MSPRRCRSPCTPGGSGRALGRGRRAARLAGRVCYEPPLPGDPRSAHPGGADGSVIKCLAVYGETFWRSRGYNGQATSDGPGARVTFDTGPPGERAPHHPRLRHHRSGPTSRLVDPGQRRVKMLASFGRYFGCAPVSSWPAHGAAGSYGPVFGAHYRPVWLVGQPGCDTSCHLVMGGSAA
jgi:hypothetical protein